MINVVMLVYNRIEIFQKQMETIVNQTVAKDIHLHVISNNVEYNYSEILVKYKDKIKVTFYQANNENRILERHIYAHSKELDFVVFLDDDLMLLKDDIEKLWNQREKKCFTTFFGRRFINGGDPKNWYRCNQPFNGDVQTDTFHYGGPGFSVIDCRIYYDFFNIYNKWPELKWDFENVDDIMLSWVVNQTPGWKIKNAKMFLNLTAHGDDNNATWKKIFKKKEFLVKKLDDILSWDRTK